MMIVDQKINSPNLILYYTGRNIIFIIDIEEINGKEKDLWEINAPDKYGKH